MTKKKIAATVCIILGLILAAVAIYFVSTLSDIPSGEEENKEKEARKLIYSEDASLFESLTVSNEYGSYTLIKKEDNIVISGGENITLLPASSKAMFEAFADVYVVKTISEDSNEGFGFENPSAVLSLKRTDGSTKTLYLGDLAPNTDGCRYMNFGGEKAVYLLDKDRSSRYTAAKSSLYSKTVSKYFSAEKLVSISIVKTDGEEILLRPSNEKESSDINYISGYTIEKPFLFGADSDMVTSLCKTLANLPSAEIADDEVSEEKLNSYGISGGVTVTVVANYDTTSMTFDSGEVNPYYDAENKDGYITLTTTYKIGETRGNLIYFTYDGAPIIYSLEKSYMDFINTETYQYCQRLVNIAYLTELSGLSVDCFDGTVCDFEINTEKDKDGNLDVSSVTVDYVKTDVENFKSFYQNVVAITHSGIGTKPENAETVLKIVYKFSSGEVRTVEFSKLPDDGRKAFMTIDGEGRFIVLMTKVDKIKSDLHKLLNGEQIYTEVG